VTYDYLCEACFLEFEVSQKITEDPLKVHLNVDGVQCGPVKRLLSAPAAVWKGGGPPTPKTYS
jgi:putative FmdB family regulatory protein